MEIIIGAVTSFLLAAGIIFTAIYQAKGSTEKTLRELVESLDRKITRIENEKRDEGLRWEERCKELQKKYDTLLLMNQKEQRRGDRLERKIKALQKAR